MSTLYIGPSPTSAERHSVNSATISIGQAKLNICLTLRWRLVALGLCQLRPLTHGEKTSDLNFKKPEDWNKDSAWIKPQESLPFCFYSHSLINQVAILQSVTKQENVWHTLGVNLHTIVVRLKKKNHVSVKRDFIKRDIRNTKEAFSRFSITQWSQKWKHNRCQLSNCTWKSKKNKKSHTQRSLQLCGFSEAVSFSFLCLMTGAFAAAGLFPAINQTKPPEKEKIKVIIWCHSSVHCAERLRVAAFTTGFRFENEKYCRGCCCCSCEQIWQCGWGLCTNDSVTMQRDQMFIVL